jgi:DNA-binding response OmpR family regulator
VPRVWKILVIDDDQAILDFLAMVLQAEGYAVATAASGSETITRVDEFKPDLILLDMKFPPCSENHQSTLEDGVLILSWLRGMSPAAKTPVIVISGSDPTEYRDRALAGGALATFQKPLEMKTLLEFIRTTLDSRSQAPQKPAESQPCW